LKNQSQNQKRLKNIVGEMELMLLVQMKDRIRWCEMRDKISHTTIQAVDAPVEKCVLTQKQGRT
jgi:hypothetical protein